MHCQHSSTLNCCAGVNSGASNGHAHSTKANGATNSKVIGSSISGSSSDEDSIASKTSRETAFDVNKLQKLRTKPKKGPVPLEGPKAISKEETGSKKTKKNRVWGDAPPPSKLDYTDPVIDEEEEGKVHTALENGLSLMDKDDEDESYEVEDIEEEEERESKKVAPKKGWLSSLVQRYISKFCTSMAF